MKACIIIVLLCFKSVILIGVDFDLSTDRSNWIDPNDPLSNKKTHSSNLQNSILTLKAENCQIDSNSQCKKENENLRKMYSSLENLKKNSVDVLLKHILSRFITVLNIDLYSNNHIYRNADINISPNELRIIRRYLNSQQAVEEISLRENLRVALENFITNNRSNNSLLTFFYKLMPYFALLNLLMLPAAIWCICRSIKKFRQVIIFILLITFSVSCYFTYNKKYQEILAQRFERTEHKFGCTVNGLLSEAYDLLLSFVKIKGKSECLQHFEDLLIEPIWLIDPLQIIAEVISNFLFTPISVVGSHLNKFFNDFFINTPIHFAIIKCGFLLLLLFYLTGYRLRTIFGTIEPAGLGFVSHSFRLQNNQLSCNSEKFLQHPTHNCLSIKPKQHSFQYIETITSKEKKLCNKTKKINLFEDSNLITLQLDKLNKSTDLNLAKAKEMCKKYKLNDASNNILFKNNYLNNKTEILHQLSNLNVMHQRCNKKKTLNSSNSTPNFSMLSNIYNF